MLQIGNKPILQTIIEQFRVAGIKNIHISVNYKADVIIDYFGDGSNFGVDIVYLYEKNGWEQLVFEPDKPKDGLSIFRDECRCYCRARFW